MSWWFHFFLRLRSPVLSLQVLLRDLNQAVVFLLCKKYTIYYILS